MVLTRLYSSSLVAAVDSTSSHDCASAEDVSPLPTIISHQNINEWLSEQTQELLCECDPFSADRFPRRSPDLLQSPRSQSSSQCTPSQHPLSRRKRSIQSHSSVLRSTRFFSEPTQNYVDTFLLQCESCTFFAQEKRKSTLARAASNKACSFEVTLGCSSDGDEWLQNASEKQGLPVTKAATEHSTPPCETQGCAFVSAAFSASPVLRHCTFVSPRSLFDLSPKYPSPTCDRTSSCDISGYRTLRTTGREERLLIGPLFDRNVDAALAASAGKPTVSHHPKKLSGVGGPKSPDAATNDNVESDSATRKKLQNRSVVFQSDVSDQQLETTRRHVMVAASPTNVLHASYRHVFGKPRLEQPAVQISRLAFRNSKQRKLVGTPPLLARQRSHVVTKLRRYTAGTEDLSLDPLRRYEHKDSDWSDWNPYDSDGSSDFSETSAHERYGLLRQNHERNKRLFYHNENDDDEALMPGHRISSTTLESLPEHADVGQNSNSSGYIKEILSDVSSHLRRKKRRHSRRSTCQRPPPAKLLDNLVSFEWKSTQCNSSMTHIISLRDSIMGECDGCSRMSCANSSTRRGGATQLSINCAIPSRESNMKLRQRISSSRDDRHGVHVVAAAVIGWTAYRRLTEGIKVECFVAVDATSWASAVTECTIRINPIDALVAVQTGGPVWVVPLTDVFELSRHPGLIGALLQGKPDTAKQRPRIFARVKRVLFRRGSADYVGSATSSCCARERAPGVGNKVTSFRKNFRQFLVMSTFTHDIVVITFSTAQDVQKFIDLVLFLQSYHGITMATVVDPLLTVRHHYGSLSIVQSAILTGCTPPSTRSTAPSKVLRLFRKFFF